MIELQRRQLSTLLPRANIEFQERVSTCFYQNGFVVCKCTHKILAYNTVSKETHEIIVSCQEFVVTPFAPYIFNCIHGQFFRLYSEEALKDQLQVKSAKISKMEPLCVNRYNKGYYAGGYNRSRLPGQQRTRKRAIFFLNELQFKVKNKAQSQIRLKDSDQPVTMLRIQNPYLVAYCRPTIYVVSLCSHQILLSFEKQASELLILEGRYAMNCINGIGISSEGKMFAFDVEKIPFFGVEIIEQPIECGCLCMEKTGRIYCSQNGLIFEYNPHQDMTMLLCGQGEERISCLQCTPSNCLLVMRDVSKHKNLLEVYQLPE